MVWFVKSESMFPALDELLANTRQSLLNLRGPHGHWEGELSSSALSTATAVIALEAIVESDSVPPAADRTLLDRLVDRGREWLSQNQNPDGGWGDTVLSHSNISTTALVWAALSKTGGRYADVERRCEAWLQQAAGSLDPEPLSQAIIRRYGSDRTFSVPILTALALRGRLGDTRKAWKLIPSLPFELAAFPHTWYARLKLPVVSYALPALIAIGQVGHAHRPTWNPLLRLIRNAARGRTLRVLAEIQPASGGYLEATPLTSFVVMSLVGAGNGRHAVAARGVEFLVRSVRADGSWPIDTNLATWVTTLAVNALSASRESGGEPLSAELQPVLDWLMAQQLTEEHPYTHAAPGGWAWTDLTGGVPDADDTPGALLALWNLTGPAAAPKAESGVRWLLDLQNADGGIPTFCKGWGLLPFDRSSADLTAHAIRAWSIWFDHVSPALQDRIQRSTRRAFAFLAKSQRSDGAWTPLWFGNQHLSTEENPTYGTSRVLLALTTCQIPDVDADKSQCDVAAAVDWILAARNGDGGWGGGSETPSSIEETALAVEAQCEVLMSSQARNPDEVQEAVCGGIEWLSRATRGGREFPPTPIGFYFAKLWYFEQMYPVVYSLAAVGRASRLSALSFRPEVGPIPS